MYTGKEFSSVRRAGRRKVYFLGFQRKSNFLLSLGDLTAAVKPTGESYHGMKEIAVDKIIGSEDRGSDFAVGFLPLRGTMERRWSTVRDLMLGPGIPEAIRVIEYGGFYFVRDGNHRVSVAKSHDIAFLDGEVTRYDTPVSLPPNMMAVKIPHFEAKAEFQRDTHMFDYVSEEKIGEAHAESWHYLKTVALPIFRKRLIERTGRDPENGEAEHNWHENVFSPIIDIIKRQAVPALFPDRYDLDIFCDLVRTFRADTGNLAPMEAYRRYVAKYRRSHLFRRFMQNTVRFINRITATPERELERFLQITRLSTFCPNAVIARGRVDWYRFLLRQVLVTFSGQLRQELGRVPYRDEIVNQWYNELYKPASDLYAESEITMPFPVFYRLWTKYRQRQTIRSIRRYGYAKETDLKDSFSAFRKRIRGGKS